MAVADVTARNVCWRWHVSSGVRGGGKSPHWRTTVQEWCPHWDCLWDKESVESTEIPGAALCCWYLRKALPVFMNPSRWAEWTPKCSCVYAALLPSFISRGCYRGLQAKPTFWVLSELFSQGSPDCRTSGLFQNRLLFPYLCWVSGLGLISRKIPWNCIFFCHRSMEESPSDIATKLLRVPMTFWSSFLSAYQMWLFFSLVPKFCAGKMRV